MRGRHGLTIDEVTASASSATSGQRLAHEAASVDFPGSDGPRNRCIGLGCDGASREGSVCLGADGGGDDRVSEELFELLARAATRRSNGPRGHRFVDEDGIPRSPARTA